MIFACFCAQFLIWWCQHKLWRKVESTFPQSPLSCSPPPHSYILKSRQPKKATQGLCKTLCLQKVSRRVSSGKWKARPRPRRLRVSVWLWLRVWVCECECECKCECGLVVSLAAYKFVRGFLLIPSCHEMPHKGYNKGRASGLPTCFKYLHVLRYLFAAVVKTGKDICYISTGAVADNVRFSVHSDSFLASKLNSLHSISQSRCLLSFASLQLACFIIIMYFLYFCFCVPSFITAAICSCRPRQKRSVWPGSVALI